MVRLRFVRRTLVTLCVAGAVPVIALPVGQANCTPTLDVLPVHGFRIDLGVVGTHGVTSMRSGRRGDLWGPYLAINYGAAPNAVLAVDGIVYKQFRADRGSGSSAVGDFIVWGKFILGADPPNGRGYGVRFGAKLPNTPSNKDFGTNQTDFFMHLFAGMETDGWDLSAFGGIGILERPGGDESQDDVVMMGVLGRRPFGRGVMTIEAEGFSKSRIYGDNWALHLGYERQLRESFGILLAGQLSTGRLYGTGEFRTGLVFRF